MKVFDIQKLKNIKIDRFLVWHWSIIVFLILVAIILAINIHLFLELEKEMSADVQDVKYVPKQVKEDLLENVVLQIEKKQENFEDALLRNFGVQDL